VVARDPAWILVKKEFVTNRNFTWTLLCFCSGLILSRVIRTYLIARCPYIHTAYLLSIIQQLDHIALGHYTQLMGTLRASSPLLVTTGPRSGSSAPILSPHSDNLIFSRDVRKCVLSRLLCRSLVPYEVPHKAANGTDGSQSVFEMRL